jgi:Na+/H+ antiporter NhaD/arsenite permease-like protein
MTQITLVSRRLAAPLGLLGVASPAWAAGTPVGFDWTSDPVGVVVIGIFLVAYAFVVFEERLHLQKSKPVMLAAALIWGTIAWHVAAIGGDGDAVREAFRHVFLEFAELFFFLVVAMAYVTAMAERSVFEAMRAELLKRGLGYRQLFWLTGLIAFFMSPLLDNLTTALVMSGVILAVGAGNQRFVCLAFINLVVAANAGGAWSAFGDITTLMAWQAQKAEVHEFLWIFVPSVVNWLVPALCMHFAVPPERPAVGVDDADVKPGGVWICVLFAVTIAVTVGGKLLLHMPPVFGMMAGLALLKLFGYWLAHREAHPGGLHVAPNERYNIFRIIANAEWDTLLFFYGVLVCVGGLSTVGYMELASRELYGGLGHTWANVVMGTLSAIVDNIPIMYAVLQMSPPMDKGQWLLITLTCGVGGSMLSVGSAAGVALMGQSKGLYTFFSHLRWTWAIALGYVLSIATHLWLNAGLFTNGVWR